ncbi:MAG: hypothetical protein JWP75_243 [Frondihabitans sp.]|nr:hypothetical protein [Frondihabitans sp.]
MKKTALNTADGMTIVGGASFAPRQRPLPATTAGLSA